MRKLPPRQQFTFALVVAGTATIVSALFGFLSAFSSRPDELMPTWIVGLSAGAVAGAIYAGLAGNRRVPFADGAARAAALSSGGATRILVFRQGFVGKLQGIDVLVDGVVRTQLKSPRFAALAVEPGEHLVETLVMGNRSAPLTVSVPAGATAAVQVEVGLGKAKPTARPDVEVVRATLATTPMVAS